MPGLPPYVEPAISQLDIDILTLVARLQQMDKEMTEEPHSLWADRIIACDVPRMLSHVSPSALAWALAWNNGNPLRERRHIRP